MNKFLKEFKDRGYFYQCTSEADLSNLLLLKSIYNLIRVGHELNISHLFIENRI